MVCPERQRSIGVKATRETQVGEVVEFLLARLMAWFMTTAH